MVPDQLLVLHQTLLREIKVPLMDNWLTPIPEEILQVRVLVVRQQETGWELNLQQQETAMF